MIDKFGTDKLGCMIIDLQDTSVSPDEREMLNHPLTGGVILFARNYESQTQLKDLCRQIRLSRQTPILIMVDQEGGRVQRFINEFTRLPYLAEFGKIYDQNPEQACRLAHHCAWLMATELLSVGIDLSLSPVLDLNKGISSVIGQRAFHAHPEQVITIATAFIKGMHEAGMPSTGKHFPGHGSVTLDSHVAIPVDERSLQEIKRDDMIPFAGMIKASISAIMAAHIVFPKVDKMPVGFSSFWLQEVLRQQLGFKGVIVSDDLNMEGANISSDYSDRVIAAREAGCDLTLLCNNRKGVIQALDKVPISSHRISKEKWGALQGFFSGMNVSYKETPRWQETHKILREMENRVSSA